MKRITLIASAAIALTSLGLNADKPTVYAVSNAHLDTQWNWDIQATIRDHIRRTLDQNLFLLDHYPDYIFNFEGGVKYNWMKEYYPTQFERMKEYVKNGRWHLTGASWDANDVNVPSTESLIRNIMLGQNFYRNEFGVESTDIFLPDCFGFGYTLPTVAKHCGLIGFSSQKLGWRQKPFHGKSRYPFPIGLWKGVDGEGIMMAHGYKYTQHWNDDDLKDDSQVAKLAKESPIKKVFHYYGTGDTGGAPSVGSVDAVHNAAARDGEIKVISAESDRLFRDYLPYENHPELPVYQGELLMDVHGTGCYTSQTAMKLYNRQNEQLGDAAERGAITAALFTGHNYPTESLTEAWRRFIFHQFHDDLTGTSIPRAYEFSWNDELLTLKQFSDLLTDAATDVAASLDTEVEGTPILLFNPLGYDNTDVVTLEIEAASMPESVVAKDHNGNIVNSQLTGYENGKAIVAIEASVPSVGYAVYDIQTVCTGNEKKASQKVSELENSKYALKFNKDGDISSLIDKQTGKELIEKGKSIRLAMFTNNPSYSWPAWEIIKSTLDAEPVSIADDVEIQLVEDGPLMKTVKITKKHGDSGFAQFVRLYEGALAHRIDFLNTIDWESMNSLLKAEFPLSVASKTATYDLGIGVAERGNNTDIAYEVPAQQWADLSDENYGVTILNDSRYGWDKPDDNTLRLTLLHTPETTKGYRYQDHQDLGRHEFTYSMIPHQGKLNRAQAVREGERLNQRIKAFTVPKSAGAGKTMSFLSTDTPDISVKALKGAENGEGVIVRVYENSGKQSNGNVTFSRNLRKAQLADGTEKVIKDVPFKGNTLNVSLKPNSIATYKLYFDMPETATVKSQNIALPYNCNALTWDGYREDGGLTGGYSYSGDLMPEKITSAGVDFKIEKHPYRSAVKCNGDTVMLPKVSGGKLHLLMAADTDNSDIHPVIKIGDKEEEIALPSYTGFIGQWGHDEHTEGYMKPQRVAYAGTHRHSTNADEPYEMTYLFHYTYDIPEDAGFMVLPSDSRAILFAATVTEEEPDAAIPAHALFRTSNRENVIKEEETYQNLLKPEMIIAYSGYVDNNEKPEFLVDGDAHTKWCDVTGNPPQIVFDLSEVKEIKGWKLLNAGEESTPYITSACYLLGRNSIEEDWRTIDVFTANKKNLVNRKLSTPQKARYIKLMVTSPTQNVEGNVARLYEMELY